MGNNCPKCNGSGQVAVCIPCGPIKPLQIGDGYLCPDCEQEPHWEPCGACSVKDDHAMSADCWCGPTILNEDNADVIVHRDIRRENCDG